METKIYSALSGSTLVTGKVGTRLYPSSVPQFTAYPSLLYTRITGVKTNSLDGYTGQEHVSFQLDAFAKTYAEAWQLSTAVQTVLTASTLFVCVMDADRDLSEPLPDGTMLYRISQDFSIWGDTT